MKKLVLFSFCILFVLPSMAELNDRAKAQVEFVDEHEKDILGDARRRAVRILYALNEIESFGPSIGNPIQADCYIIKKENNYSSINFTVECYITDLLDGGDWSEGISVKWSLSPNVNNKTYRFSIQDIEIAEH